jgi:hypothetical protein
LKRQKKKGGKLLVDLAELAKTAISPVLRKFPFCFSFRVASEVTRPGVQVHTGNFHVQMQANASSNRRTGSKLFRVSWFRIRDSLLNLRVHSFANSYEWPPEREGA